MLTLAFIDMAFFFNPQTGVVQIDSEVYDSWLATGNPKADYYQPIPDRPGSQHYWDGNQWLQPPPLPPLAEWDTFKATALNSSSLNEILASAYQVAPVAAGALAPALLKAEAGVPADFQAAWATIVKVVAVPSSVIESFQDVAKSCNLPSDFVQALAPGRVRARNTDGTFRADDPSTPDVDEAWAT